MSVLTVATTQQLSAALASAQSGDTILLASGTYSGVSFQGVKFAGTVTISSQTPGDPAILTDLRVTDSAGLTFKNLEFSVADSKVHNPVTVQNSDNIHFKSIDVHGSIDGDFTNEVYPMLIRSSRDVSITNSEFHDVLSGFTHLDSQRLVFTGNDFHDIREDGIRGGGSSDVLVSKNTFRDFYPNETDHSDAIQFWTTNTTKVTENLVITDNLIQRGAGGLMQGVFVHSVPTDPGYANVTVTGNLAIGTLYNGVHVIGATGAKVLDNTVISTNGQTTWVRVESSTNALVQGNTAKTYVFADNTAFTELGNKLNAFASALDTAKAAQAWLISKASAASLPDVLSQLLGGLTSGRVAQQIGSEGDDTLRAPDAGGWIEAGGGRDQVYGGDGSDYLRGGGGDDVIDGGARFDDINGNTGSDTLLGGLGNDWVAGGQDQDVLFGEDGDDIVYGNLGNDTGYGGDGADWLRGGQGDDVLYGGAGSDTLSGDRGADTLAGGAGADEFYMFSGSGVDRVTDFTVGVDRVKLDAGASYSVSQVGQDAVVRLSSGDEMVLVGVQTSSLSGGWVVVG